MLESNPIIKYLKQILIYSSSIYISYLVLLSIALIFHQQIISSNVILAVIVGIATYYFSLKHGLHPVSAIIGTYFFHWLNLSTLNSKYFLKLYYESHTLALYALFIEPWLHLVVALIISYIAYRKYLENRPPVKKQIFYE